MRTRYKDLSMQQIRTFREVCRAGSYTGVAKMLGLSTSAVWEQMRGLERYFSATLLEKNGGALLPTADGRLLLELVDPILSRLETTKEMLHQRRGELPATMTAISGMRMLMEEIVAGIVRFRRDYPSIRVRMLHVPDHAIDGWIARGEADLAIVLERGPEEPASTAVQHEVAYEHDYLLLCPPRHPLLSKRSLRLADMLGFPLVVGTKGTRSRAHIDEVLHRQGLSEKTQIAIETNSTAITCAAVRAGAGIGIVAAPVDGSLSRGLRIRSLQRWFGKARFVFVWRRGAIVTPLQRQLADHIRSCSA